MMIGEKTIGESKRVLVFFLREILRYIGEREKERESAWEERRENIYVTSCEERVLRKRAAYGRAEIAGCPWGAATGTKKHQPHHAYFFFPFFLQIYLYIFFPGEGNFSTYDGLYEDNSALVLEGGVVILPQPLSPRNVLDIVENKKK